MEDNASSDHDTIISTFQAKLRDCTVQGTCGRHYVLVAKLKQWMGSDVGLGHSTTHTSRLLSFAYRQLSHQPARPVSEDQISCGEDSCLLVFSILLEIHCGTFVDQFRRLDIVDRFLPVPKLILDEKIRKMDLGSTDKAKLGADFEKLQWRFCAAKFELRTGHHYFKNRIIPICQKKRINNKGGTADLWEIGVQEEFVGDTLRETVRNSRYIDSKDNFGYRYLFALKEYKEGNRALYINERNAFLGLQEHEGMVRYLAEYSHEQNNSSPSSPLTAMSDDSDGGTTTTHNILLEYGEMDLDEFFIMRKPPVLQTEIESFWKGLFEVADAVEGIHNLKIKSGDNTVQEFHGWHADIKPDNILSVQGKFKLADPGFATFVKKKNDKIPKEFVLGGTETYGAPERHPGRRESRIAVPQTIDTWSLGCVFSIAATWVVLGRQGIPQYRKMREKAIKKIIQDQESQSSSGSARPALNKGDYFHNGRQVLADVIKWHDLLRQTLRKTDTITSQVLDLVDQRMLLDDATKRTNAKDICTELKKITVQSQAEPQNPMPKVIMEALLEVDEEAPSQSVPTASYEVLSEMSRSLTESDDRKARKSKLLDFPLMKTTHRSEYLKSALAAQNIEPIISGSRYPILAGTNPVPHDAGLRSSLPYHSRQSNNSQSNRLQRGPAFHEMPFEGSILTVSARKKQSKKTIATQSVFQAREELEREKHNFFRKTRKDELLTRHFHNRDIKFLVDNAETMEEFWYQATYLLETLVMKSSGQDENGMDLSFTAGQIKVGNKNDSSAFTKAMKDTKARPQKGMHTDMKRSLGDIFSKYLGELKAQRYLPTKQVKNLTLIVLTDGIWAGMSNKDDVKQKIIIFAKEMAKIHVDLVERPVSIEFIRFGNDEDAAYRLSLLDNDLKWDGIPDIVDTEPCTGNVNKMLLGSFVEEFDEEDGDEISAPGSPDRRIGSSEGLRRTATSTSFQPFFPDQNRQTISP